MRDDTPATNGPTASDTAAGNTATGAAADTAATDTAAAWLDQVAYHRERADNERKLAARARTEAARAAHLVLCERHLQLAGSAEMVAAMPDPERPQSSTLHHTGWLMRESYATPV